MDYNITLFPEKMRNWRVVRAKDSEGVERDCLLLPMEINGITQYKGRYCWNLYACDKIDKNNVKYTHTLIPFLPPETRKKMMEEGLVSPDDKYFAQIVGKMMSKSKETWTKKPEYSKQ